MARNRKIVSLFPYQIKNINNFLFRDHPEQVHPKSPVFDKYWSAFEKYVIEGKWVNDEGTWVFMPPKLFFYVNYAKVPFKDRVSRHPDLRDNEWIIFSYFLCCEGFSGFELDEKYTCHKLVGMYEKWNDPSLSDKNKEKFELDEYQLKSIPDSAKKPNGGFKKYIDPWYYLTRHYLLDEPATKPLGRALYENPIQNAVILSARGVGKSFTTFVGDFLHEWLTSGIKTIEEREHVNKKLLFGIGSARTVQLDRSLGNVSACYDSMPGQYEFADPKVPTYMGPFYKKIRGTWKHGNVVDHLVQKKNRTRMIEGSSAQIMAITKDAITIGAGDRFRRIYIEEFGFLSYAIDVHAANKDSLRAEGERVGMAVYLGTGGDLEAIRQPKMLFDTPESYDIFGIPDYWKNPRRKIGLFVPVHYALRQYKDPNGNTDINAADEFIMKQRAKDREEMDSVSYDLEVTFNPVEPDEMLRPSNNNILPRQEAAEQLSYIEAYDIFRKRAQIGKLHWDPLANSGISWKKDLTGRLRPIIEWGVDDKKVGKEGAIIIYEQPPQHIPDNLYWISYDPAKQSGDSESYHSVLVYKYFYTGDEKTLEDCIVAEWIGRKERLEDNYEEVVKIAKYFNARIFTEINVAGFIHWAADHNYYNLLEGDAYQLEQEIHGNKPIKRNHYRKGYQLNDRKKNWALTKARDWLTHVRERDPDTDVPTLRTIHKIMSPRLLSEIINFQDDKNLNFDHISSLVGLMLLIGKISKEYEPVQLIDDESNAVDSVLLNQIQNAQNQKKMAFGEIDRSLNRNIDRSKFLTY